MDPADERRPAVAASGSDGPPKNSHPTQGVSFHGRTQRANPTSVSGFEAGRVVGDFRLTALVGQGGMGQVWEAAQLSLGGRRVAVKFVRPERVSDRQAELFEREARAGGRLNHPGIVAVYGYGQSEGVAWIAMEYVEGCWTLRDFIDDLARAEAVPPGYDRDVARLVAEIAEAMQAAHDASVIHRDLKPHNVLVTPDEHPKIGDFGLARITDEAALSQTGDFAGTYFYMSPEQVAAGRMGIDHRTDVFSLGIVLYELLTLQRPFQSDASHEVATQILTKEAADPRTIRSRIPRELAVICGKALEKDRDRRFQTMKELAEDLRRFLRDEPIQARPPTPWDRGLKWTKRNPVKSVASLVALTAFGVISWLLAANVRANDHLARTNSDLNSERGKLADANRDLELKTEEAQAAARRESAIAAQERERAEEVLRLSALQDYEDLIGRVDALWPPHPESIQAMQQWIEDARELLPLVPLCRAKRNELRANALPQSEAEREADRLGHPDLPRLRALSEELERLGQALIAASSDEEAARLALELGRVEEQQRVLERRVGERQDWRFPESMAQARWWNNQLTKLIEELESLTDPATGLLSEEAAAASDEHGWSVPRRLALARRLESGFARGGEFEERWRAALPRIAAAYPGLALVPQMALVPLGPDPDSGLWEFWHVPSGGEPRRAEDGKLEPSEPMGLVFVLVPAGSSWMGAQSEDPLGRNYDPLSQSDEAPVHEVALEAYFLSKYELTQAQWQRLAGWNPSVFQRERYLTSWNRSGREWNGLHPVEQVSWATCKRVLARMGLVVPTEAQWEHAARAGSDRPWWTGLEPESLAGAANLLDRYAKEHGNTVMNGWEEGLDDGNSAHAEVGSYRPNAFGLHDVAGNLWEWCRDWGGAYEFPVRAGDGERQVTGIVRHVIRGGSWDSLAAEARSANRDGGVPELESYDVGVRPARAITR